MAEMTQIDVGPGRSLEEIERAGFEQWLERKDAHEQLLERVTQLEVRIDAVERFLKPAQGERVIAVEMSEAYRRGECQDT
jgi:ferric-dicitrate binding protein FerR (iron transport regulator)